MWTTLWTCTGSPLHCSRRKRPTSNVARFVPVNLYIPIYSTYAYTHRYKWMDTQIYMSVCVCVWISLYNPHASMFFRCKCIHTLKSFLLDRYTKAGPCMNSTYGVHAGVDPGQVSERFFLQVADDLPWMNAKSILYLERTLLIVLLITSYIYSPLKCYLSSRCDPHHARGGLILRGDLIARRWFAKDAVINVWLRRGRPGLTLGNLPIHKRVQRMRSAQRREDS